MEHGRTVLTEAVRKVQLLKIDGYSATSAFERSEYIKSNWDVDGHRWEVQFYPCYYLGYRNCSRRIALELILLSAPRRNKLKVNLSCQLVDRPSVLLLLLRRVCPMYFRVHPYCHAVDLSTGAEMTAYLVNDLLTVQCIITVLKEQTDILVPADTEAPLPPSDLHRHFGELWHGQRGTDITFVLESGERFLAYKAILAARSPVFMVDFFGGMRERSSQRSIRIEDIDADVFKAMLHFIYTDRAPELDQEPEVVVTMAQHLLAAADRYGLDRLKLICESKLAGGISIDTVATTLALAEQHNCSLFKVKCVNFIARSPETLDAVLATEGYNHLVASCPLVVTQLLRAACGRRIYRRF